MCILRSSNNNSLHIFGWTSVGDPENVDMIMFISFLQRNISISHWRHSLTQKLMIWRRIGFLFLDSWHLYNRPLSFNSVQSFLFPPSHPKSLIRLCRIVHNWKRNFPMTLTVRRFARRLVGRTVVIHKFHFPCSYWSPCFCMNITFRDEFSFKLKVLFLNAEHLNYWFPPILRPSLGVSIWNFVCKIMKKITCEKYIQNLHFLTPPLPPSPSC